MPRSPQAPADQVHQQAAPDDTSFTPQTTEAANNENAVPEPVPAQPPPPERTETAANWESTTPNGLTLRVTVRPTQAKPGDAITFDIWAQDSRGSTVLVGEDFGDGTAHGSPTLVDHCFFPQSDEGPPKPTAPRTFEITHTHAYEHPGTYHVVITARTYSCHYEDETVQAGGEIHIT